jgi:chromosome segregation ATPase
LNAKSEEILRLEASIERFKVKADEMSDHVKRLSDELTAATARETDLNQQLAEARAKLTIMENQRFSEKSAWDTEREGLVSSLEARTISQANTEKDLNLFRDQYNSASAYVSTLQGENKDLTERAYVAESQVREGLQMVRGFFDDRVKKLEVESAKWKGLCQLLQEKDARTGDEIRRKAGEEGELRLRVEALEGRVEMLNEELDSLEDEKAEWERERLEWKRLAMKENGKTSIKEGPVRHTGGQNATLEGRSLNKTTANPALDRLVYQCHWRRQDRGTDEACNGTFDSIEVSFTSLPVA